MSKRPGDQIPEVVRRVGRRSFLKGVPVAVAAVVPLASGSGNPSSVVSRLGKSMDRAQDSLPPQFKTDSLKGAEQVIGVHFTDAEEEMALPGATRNLENFETAASARHSARYRAGYHIPPASARQAAAGAVHSKRGAANRADDHDPGDLAPRRPRVRAGHRLVGAHPETAGDVDRSHQDVPGATRKSTTKRCTAW